jgi:hypothetical protein
MTCQIQYVLILTGLIAHGLESLVVRAGIWVKIRSSMWLCAGRQYGIVTVVGKMPLPGQNRQGA